MSEIAERIREDQKGAMKAGDKTRLSTLRMVSSELQNRRIAEGRELEDDEVIEVLARARKQRREAAEQYEEGGRDDLADKELAEEAIIAEYLPEPLSDDELDRLIDGAIEATGASSVKEMGAVMGRVMPQVKGRAEGSEVSARVRKRLQQG